MKKQTYKIILLCVVIILLCLLFGKKIIHEGAGPISEIVVSTAQTIDYPEAKTDLNNATELKKDIEIETKLSEEEAKLEEAKKEAARVLSIQKQQKMTGLQSDILKLYKDIIESAFTPPVLYLPLKNDALNYAKSLGIKDPTNETKEANRNISGSTTSLAYGSQGGKSCVYFNNDMNNYISFPVNPGIQFSFCFWIYMDLTDKTKQYSVASLTNKKYMHPSIQVDIMDGDSIVVVNALPGTNNWTNWYSYKTNVSGWVHFTYTFKCDANRQNISVNLYANKNKITNIWNPTPNVPLRYFQDDPNKRNNILFSPDYFILGRSGDSYRAYRGYIRQFLYYAMELNEKQISDIYTYTEN